MIEFQAILNKIATTLDGGWRVTIDVPESDRDQMLELAKHRQEGLRIKIVGEYEGLRNEHEA